MKKKGNSSNTSIEAYHRVRVHNRQNHAEETFPPLEAKIIQDRDFYLTLFENFPVLARRAGPDAKCNYFNKTWLEFTGRKLEDELGDGWIEGIHPEDHNQFLETYLGAFESRLPFEMAYRLHSVKEDYRWVLDIAKPYDDLSGEFSGYIGVCFDIAERKESEDALNRLINIEQMIAKIAKRFIVIEREKIDEEIIGTLFDIAAFAKPEKIYIIFLTSDKKSVDQLYKYDRNTTRAWVEEKEISPGDYEWVAERLANHIPVCISVCPDLFNDEDGVKKFLTSNELKFMLLIPLLHAGDLIGGMGLMTNDDENSWTQEDINDLTIIANMISNVIAHIKTEEMVTRQLTTHQRDLSVLYQVAAVSSELLDKKILLDKILATILETIRCKAAAIHLFDKDKTLYFDASTAILSDSKAFLQKSPISWGILEKMEKLLEPVLIEHLPGDINLDKIGTSEGINSHPIDQKIQPCSYYSYLGVPILVRDELMGILSLFSPSEKAYSKDEIALSTAVAKYIGLVLKSIDLVQRETKQAIENERSKLARDLHDSITQSLYSLMLFSNAAQDAAKYSHMDRLETCLSRISEQSLLASKHMRLLLYGLNLDLFHQEGVVKAINYRLNTVERHLGIDAQLEVDLLVPIPKSMEWDLFFSINEALTNSLKHAQASCINILIRSYSEYVFVRVSDNGIGFDVDAAIDQGMGLKTMRERAENLGAEFSIKSELEKGTEIVIEVRR